MWPVRTWPRWRPPPVADPGLRAYNVASGRPATVGEMAAVLAAAVGGPEPVVTGEFRLGDVRHIVASPTRAAAELGLHRAGRPGHRRHRVRSRGPARMTVREAGPRPPGADLLAAGSAFGLIALAAVTGGLLYRAGRPVHASSAPFTGVWLPHAGPGTPLVLAVAALVVLARPAPGRDPRLAPAARGRVRLRVRLDPLARAGRRLAAGRRRPARRPATSISARFPGSPMCRPCCAGSPAGSSTSSRTRGTPMSPVIRRASS